MALMAKRGLMTQRDKERYESMKPKKSPQEKIKSVIKSGGETGKKAFINYIDAIKNSKVKGKMKRT